MAASTNVQTLSGNRVRVSINSLKVGLIQNVRGSDDYGNEPASGVGDAHVVEYVPGMARYTVNVSVMWLIKQKLETIGIIPNNADAVLRGNVFDISVFSKDNGSLIKKYISCSFNSGEVEVQKHAIITRSAVFNALDVDALGSP